MRWLLFYEVVDGFVIAMTRLIDSDEFLFCDWKDES